MYRTTKDLKDNQNVRLRVSMMNIYEHKGKQRMTTVILFTGFSTYWLIIPLKNFPQFQNNYPKIFKNVKERVLSAFSGICITNIRDNWIGEKGPLGLQWWKCQSMVSCHLCLQPVVALHDERPWWSKTAHIIARTSKRENEKGAEAPQLNSRASFQWLEDFLLGSTS
jgi:hypothetical protein